MSGNLDVAGDIKFDAAQDIIVGSTMHSLLVKNTAASSCGLVLQGSNNEHRMQLYGSDSGYGFLDGPWANWDIKKVPNGIFEVDEGSGLKRVWNAGNDGSGSGLDADTVDGIQGSSFVRKDLGDQVINGDHGSARLQIRRTDTVTEGHKAYLSMWASEPGVSYDGAGIGGNIANSGFYYGVENTANAGALIRWHDGNTEFKYLPAVQGAGNSGSRTFYIDTSGNCTASGNVTAYSDERLKTNIKTITTPLDKVKALRGVTFDKDGERGLGVIAQETEAVIPEVVMTADDDMGTKSVAYGNIVGLLIEAIKEQQTQIDELKSLIK
jgi:hypothetical protein